MPWLRTGDTAANHPIALAVLEDPAADDRLLNEVFGFVSRCALQSTAHLTDYLVSRGTAIAMAGMSRVNVLVDVAIDAGYFSPAEMIVDGIPRPAYKLIDDPDFIHMRTREEIEWERQRQSDNSNPALVIPVRLRDGDACRYCGLVVDFRHRRGRIAGTYDHREPGREATIETYVVACKGCNSKRGNNPRADVETPLLPEPLKPYYSPSTIEWLKANDWAKRNGIKPPRKGKTIEPGKPAPTATQSGATPANGSTSGPAPGSETDPTGEAAQPGNGSTTGQAGTEKGSTGARNAEKLVKSAQKKHTKTPPESPLTSANAVSAGYLQIQQNARLSDLETSGRDGTGRDGTGRDGSPTLTATTHTTHMPPSRVRPRTRKGNR